MLPPAPQSDIRMRAGLAHSSLNSHLGWGSPSQASPALRMPNWGLRIHCHSSATATPETTDGK